MIKVKVTHKSNTLLKVWQYLILNCYRLRVR